MGQEEQKQSWWDQGGDGGRWGTSLCWTMQGLAWRDQENGRNQECAWDHDRSEGHGFGQNFNKWKTFHAWYSQPFQQQVVKFTCILYACKGSYTYEGCVHVQGYVHVHVMYQKWNGLNHTLGWPQRSLVDTGDGCWAYAWCSCVYPELWGPS